MITKKEQLIVDSVNYLKSEHCNYKFIVRASKLNVIYPRGYFSNNNIGAWSQGWEDVCTIEEFNQCVKEMERIHGGVSYAEYIINCNNFGTDTTNKTLTKENSDYSFYEKENKMQNVYTQEMKDNSVLPSVGMRFICDDNTAGSKISDFYGMEVCIIGICDTICHTVITFRHHSLGIACGAFHESWVKPIDTRTPEQKQVDDIREFLSSEGFYMEYTAIEILQENGHLAEIIKPL